MFFYILGDNLKLKGNINLIRSYLLGLFIVSYAKINRQQFLSEQSRLPNKALFLHIYDYLLPCIYRPAV